MLISDPSSINNTHRYHPNMLNTMHLSSLSTHARIMHPWLPSRPSTCHFSHHLSSFDSSTTSRILPEHPSNPSSTCWCRGFESHISPPSRRRPLKLSSLPVSSTSLLVEASPEGAAQMERDALGCDGFVLVTSLGLPMIDLGLEKKPNPGIVNGRQYSLKWMGCVEKVGALGLGWSTKPKFGIQLAYWACP